MSVDSLKSSTSETTTKRRTKKEADQFYGMVDAAPFAALFINDAGNVDYLNTQGHEFFRQFADTLGFGPEQIVGQPAAQLYGVCDEFKKATSDVESKSSVRFQHGDEWFDVRISPVTGSDGKQTGTLQTWESATDAVRAEEIAVENTGRMEAISKAQAVIEFNLDGTIITANDNFLTTLGYTLEEIQGQHHRLFVDDAFAASAEYKEFWAKLNRGEFESNQYLRLGKGGKEVWIQASYNPIIDLNGNPFKVVKFATDITAQKVLERDAARVQSMVDEMPTNVIMANLDLEITYLNPASIEKLRTLEEFLPIKVDDMVGQNIDIFHKVPEHQRKILADPKNLPHRAEINVGPEILDLLVSAVRDNNGEYIGPMVSWEVITEKLKAENEMARVSNMMDAIPINVALANRDYELVYFNPASITTLTSLQHLLPMPVDQLLGQKIDIFHKVPDHQRRIVDDPSNLPHRAKISLGEETLDLLVSAINDADGNYIGPMITWSIITEQVKMADDFETNVKAVVEGVTASATQMQGNSKNMAATADESARQAQVVAAASEEATKNVETVSSAAEELSASIGEISRHVQDASTMTQQAVQEAEDTKITMKELGESSDEIGQVIKVITSIAQQTNLLALNATIEAARAGEAGKGFAVVANEVKELARQTAKATEDISQKIGSIQSATGGAASAIQSIGDRISKIDEIATTIARAVEEQTAATSEISRNVAEAAKGTAEVTSNISGVSQAADESGKGATEMLTASDALAEESKRLDELTTKFLERMRAI